MTPPRCILFAGVGGQGVLSAARILGEAAHHSGIAVAVSQLHGMSQRGGAVQATVLIGASERLHPGGAPVDVLVGLELIESLRAAHRLDKGSVALVSRWLLPPRGFGGVPAPEQVLAELRARAGTVIEVDAPSLADRAGSRAAVNSVMLGALSRLASLPFGPDEILAAMRGGAGAELSEVNRRAFALGAQAAPEAGDRSRSIALPSARAGKTRSP
ncbi:MAG: 2-oxoacid:acceptor oxidoreductase family protein [Myxococcales bacterium]|nr:2-oxoacid:acceptor oxidoreductase family protein [Myxococcales bacterium]